MGCISCLYTLTQTLHIKGQRENIRFNVIQTNTESFYFPRGAWQPAQDHYRNMLIFSLAKVKYWIYPHPFVWYDSWGMVSSLHSQDKWKHTMLDGLLLCWVKFWLRTVSIQRLVVGCCKEWCWIMKKICCGEEEKKPAEEGKKKSRTI